MRRLRCLAALGLAASLAAACGSGSGSPSEPSLPVFRMAACGEVFRVAIADPAVAAEAARRIGRGPGRILTGRLRSGGGGVNSPWSWHFAPASVAFADATIELCDGCPSYVESTVADWIGKQYCPWSSEVLARE